MYALFRRSFKTVIHSIFLRVAIATSNFLNEVDNGGFAPEFSVSMLKETIALVRDYVTETRKYKARLAENYILKQNMKSFSNETPTFFLRKVLGLLHFEYECVTLFQSFHRGILSIHWYLAQNF